MINSLSSGSSRRSASKLSTPANSCVIESLEPRAMLSGSVTHDALPMAPHYAAATVNAAPTVARAVCVNNNAPVTGRTATLSVLGSDDQGETGLSYSWSVVSAPAGGSATFSANGSNAAKSSVVTFTRAGTYSLRVTIVDSAGLSVSSLCSVVVTPTLTNVRLISAGQTLSSGSVIMSSAVRQTLFVQGFDQFGNALAAQPAFTWSIASAPAGAAAPVISASSGSAVITFSRAGSYMVAVRAGSGAAMITSNFGITLTQVISALRNTSTTPVQVAGTSLLLPVPTFVDQFGNAFASPPALTWSVYSQPQNSPAVVFSNSAGAPVATFGMAGSYYITGCVANMPSATFVVIASVNQTLSRFIVSPNTAAVYQGCDQQFTAQGLDQFQRPMTGAAPAITWSASAGTITSAGVFTAPSVCATATITASCGSASGSATVLIQSLGKYQTPVVASLVTTLDADGSLNRADMIQILRAVANNGPVTAAEFGDLKFLISQATAYCMPAYVSVLAGDVVNGNAANATYQGLAMGNLAAGSSSTQLNNLIDKWFMGTDLPTLCNKSLVYKSAAGSLFPHAPSHLDERQGGLGDCFFISALGSLADSNPAAVRNMFIDNGDGTFTVRFYYGNYGTIYNYSDGSIGAGFKDNVGTADYITVNRSLPVGTTGTLAYAGSGANYADLTVPLWIALAEKAYAQWNQTGKAGRDGTNAYASIQGGWMATVDAQVLGYNATDYIMTRTSEQVAINALAAGKSVTIGTLAWSGTNLGLYSSHAYSITAYDASTDTFTLYNPWGSDQPGQLTWAQLQATCTQMAVCDTSGAKPM